MYSDIILLKHSYTVNSTLQTTGYYYYYLLLLFSLSVQPSAGYDLVSRGFLITYNDTPQYVGDLYLTIHNAHNRQTSMPPVEFEPTIAVGERP
jgi:hypothetical protein